MRDMIFNNSVTVYHALPDGYEKRFFLRASVFGEEKLEAEKGSRTAKNEISVRVFTDREAEISAGDRLVIGRAEEDEPPADAHVIMNVLPRLKGSCGMRHYRIFAV